MAAAIESVVILRDSLKDDAMEWRPRVMVWTWSGADGLRCKMFGKEPLDGCKLGFRFYFNN